MILSILEERDPVRLPDLLGDVLAELGAAALPQVEALRDRWLHEDPALALVARDADGELIWGITEVGEVELARLHRDRRFRRSGGASRQRGSRP